MKRAVRILRKHGKISYYWSYCYRRIPVIERKVSLRDGSVVVSDLKTAVPRLPAEAPRPEGGSRPPKVGGRIRAAGLF